MADNLRVTKTSKGESNKLPKGATILKREVSTEVEEIENGYIVTRRDEIRYEVKEGESDWMYITKKWYSKEDPLQISTSNKELADAFED